METIRLSHPHQLKKENLSPKVLALGFFDGVHLGHQKVINGAMEIANQKNLPCAVMTFSPHPKEVLRKTSVDYISPIEKKIELMGDLGVDILYIVEFTLQFANLTPQEFVDQYIIGLNVVHVVAGFDYTYGRLGKGTMETLPFHSRNAFTYSTISKLQSNDIKISSTHIRSLLMEGLVEEIPNFLGRYYEVEGTVVHGEKRGRTIGFPTANIQSDGYLLPKEGVYAVCLTLNGQTFEGVCNRGYKPTFHDDAKMEATIEVHLLNFHENIYGEKVRIQWVERIRDEVKFNSVEELIYQIHCDKDRAIQILNKCNKCSCNS